MALADDIEQYYLAEIEALSTYYKFHFGSRLWGWSGDAGGRRVLEGIRAEFTYDGDHDRLMRSLTSKLQPTPTPHINAAHLRQPYLDAYPLLRPYNAILFQLRHLACVYGIDLRGELDSIIPRAELLQLREQLLSDPAALAVLSTYAVNYAYLLDRFILEDETSLSPELFYELSTRYDTTDPQQLQLLMYLYTHCIIGETLFYHRPLPEANLPVYRRMLADLEALITEHYDHIHLDNKFEFLVCASICGRETSLKARIHDEAARSLSPNGTFIIDAHNHNAQAAKADLVGSEHRNVLFVMSTRAFNPPGRPV